MAGWDVDPEAVRTLLATTTAASHDLANVIQDHTPSGNTNLRALAPRVRHCTQSPLIGAVLDDFMTAQHQDVTRIVDHIDTVIRAASQAVNTIEAGDQQMGSLIQPSMTQAGTPGHPTPIWRSPAGPR